MSTAISLHAVDYPRQAGTVHAIRHTVFVLGQGIDPALEQDSHDVSAVHVLAVDAEGQPVATARMVIDPRAATRVGTCSTNVLLMQSGSSQRHTRCRQISRTRVAPGTS